MKPIFLIFSLLVLLNIPSRAQHAIWARDIGSPSQEYPYKICTDGNNVYATGWYMNSLTICGISLPSVIQPTGTQLTGNLFISKFDSFGNCIWTNKGISIVQPNPYGPVFRGIKYDGLGHLYATGVFTDSMIFGTDTLFNPACTQDCNTPFILKMDTNGNFLWAKCFAGSGFADIGIPVIMGGNVYFSGYYKDSIFFRSIHLGTINPLVSAGYMTEIDTSGNILWAHNCGKSSTGSYNLDMAFDGSFLYTLGTFYDSLAFPSLVLRDSTPFSTLPYLAKYDTAGNLVWAKGGHSQIRGLLSSPGLKYDNAGHLYVSGVFFDSVKFYSTMFTTPSLTVNKDCIARFDTTGNFDWAIAMGNKSAGGAFAPCIAADDSGFYLFSGYTDSVTIGDSFYAAPAGGENLLLVRVRKDSAIITSKHFGGGGVPEDIITDGGVIYIAGATTGNYSIDTVSVVNNGVTDILIAKMRGRDYTHNVLTTAIDSNSSSTDYKVFPNPTDGWLSIESSETLRSLYIYSITGALLMEATGANTTAQIDLTNFRAGLYFVKIISNEGCNTIKVIKR